MSIHRSIGTLLFFIAPILVNVSQAQNGSFAVEQVEGETTATLPYIGMRFYVENDFIIPTFLSHHVFNNQDDNYTGGARAEIITNMLPVGRYWLLNPLKGSIISQSIFWGITIFTPQDLASSDVVRGERPYASYTFLGMGFTSTNPKMTKKFLSELTAGNIGGHTAGNVQTTIHRDHWAGSTRPIPQGWHHQIADGGAFAANLRLRLESKFPVKSKIRKFSSGGTFQWVQMSWRNEVNLGQYYGNYSTDARFYLFNLNSQWGEREDEPVTVGLLNATPKHRIRFYTFFTPRVKWQFHNTTLTGKLLGKSSEYTLPSAEVKPVLFEYDFGFQFRWSVLRVGYTLFGRSKEYKAENKKLHNWGGLYLGIVVNSH
jgi:hypothetical protein